MSVPEPGGWRTLAHHAAPVPDDWHAQLCERLGLRPRRLGPWAELALYGARACLDLAGEDTLPAGALLCVASLRGPVQVTRAAIEQSQGGSAMPFSFLQSQPSQMLAALCQHLKWNGDARFVLSRDPLALRRLAQLDAGPAGLLLGWVDEASLASAPAVAPHSGAGAAMPARAVAGAQPRSEWWRLVPVEPPR